VARRKTRTIPGKIRFLFVGLFVVFFGGVGAAVLSRSNAATVQPTFVTYQEYNRLRDISTGVTTVEDDIPWLGVKKVSQVAPGGVLVYDTYGGPFLIEKQICYSVRAVDTAATIELAGWQASRTVAVRTYNPTSYREYCVSRGSGDYKDFSVKHVSGGKVNVYMRTFFYQRCEPFTNPCD
jgi:hypothetical protein